MVSASLQPLNGAPLFSAHRTRLHYSSATVFKWEWRGDQGGSLVSSRTKGQTFRVLANPNVSPGEKSSGKDVIMVDPLEAKRLAAKQLQEIQAKEKYKRRREIEAINGAWAMIGLTAGLVIEGHTGKNILAQLAGYWSAIINFFVH
ncbi:Chlorophyll A-B binding protein [Melia azedarach]|uniref:Chlorophyll A-B binding protein n=1 Tax=Melia azedarach TaxID=155640 RepID=A0ACC1XDV3_MELAZ|nr:Chlorophyll A-B binding protein [Melia azedarach]